MEIAVFLLNINFNISEICLYSHVIYLVFYTIVANVFISSRGQDNRRRKFEKIIGAIDRVKKTSEFSGGANVKHINFDEVFDVIKRAKDYSERD